MTSTATAQAVLAAAIAKEDGEARREIAKLIGDIAESGTSFLPSLTARMQHASAFIRALSDITFQVSDAADRNDDVELFLVDVLGILVRVQADAALNLGRESRDAVTGRTDAVRNITAAARDLFRDIKRGALV